MNYPSILDETQQLRQYKAKNSYTNAQVATALTALGWTWGENHVASLMSGTAKATESERVYIRIFLLDKFYDYNCS